MTEQAETLRFGLKYEVKRRMHETFEIVEGSRVLRIFCCVGCAGEDSLFHYPERSTLSPDCLRCFSSLVKQSQFLRSSFSNCAATHKTAILIARARKEVPPAQRLKKCTGDIAGR